MGADIDHQHPDVSADVLNWGTWVLSQLGPGAAGFRFDAVKHIDRDFLSKFVKYVRKDRERLFGVGEFWKDSIGHLEAYLDAMGTQVCNDFPFGVRKFLCADAQFFFLQFSVFDAPLHYNFKEAGDAGNTYDLRKIWDGTVVQRRPTDAVYVSWR